MFNFVMILSSVIPELIFAVSMFFVFTTLMLAMSLIIVIIGYVGYRLLTRGERGSGLSALAAISGEA